MKKKQKRNDHYTFMFFPEGKGQPFTLRIHRYTIYLTIMSIAIFIAGITLLLFKTGEIALRLQQVHDLKQENSRLREHNRDLQLLSQKIANIDSMTAYLHRLAAVSNIGAGAPLASATRQPAQAGGSLPEAPKSAAARADAKPARPAAPAMDGRAFAASMPSIMPVDGWITKQFSSDPKPDAHKGVDIAAAHGTPIRVTAMGVVDDIRTDKYLGLTVEVRHENGFLTRYSHCSQVLVLVGDRVNRGQAIALVGNTGRSTAPHVHYEVLKDGKYIDPMSFVGTREQ